VITFYLDEDKFDAFRGMLISWLLVNRPTAGMHVFPRDNIIRITGGGCSMATIDDLVQDEIVDPTKMLYAIEDR
jgi:hypothetical protein